VRVLERGLDRLRRHDLTRKLLFIGRPRRLVGARVRRSAAANPAPGALAPILVDYYSRDGSTLMMRLLATSPQIAVGGVYPYEQKYFAYIWRWSRVLTRPDWDKTHWTGGNLSSITQERDQDMLGPPPWRRRELMEPGSPGEPSLSERCFELAWREFSRRATVQTRIQHRRPEADVRYYAEKHLNSWMLDRYELPPLRLIVLLRDPRDTYVSAVAFREQAGYAQLGQQRARNEGEYLSEFIDRQRSRLRWIAGLLGDDSTPVVRYEDLVAGLPGVALKLERWLSVQLDAEAAAKDWRISWLHRTADTPEKSIGRWRRELAPQVAEEFKRRLGPELRALGFGD
jgi:hypothetical protein